MAQFLRILLIISSLFLIISCASDDDKDGDPEFLMKKAREYDKDERYEEALRRYNDVKNKFPYNKIATEAELAIADVYYKQESYIEAQGAYQVFRELHPKHPKVDYVVYRIGLSYFKQLPETIDRDLSVANQAIKSFDEFLRLYPQSEFVKEAKEQRVQALKMLGEKELYIGDFYKKKEKCLSATGRYQNLLKLYSGLGFDDKANKGLKACHGKDNGKKE